MGYGERGSFESKFKDITLLCSCEGPAGNFAPVALIEEFPGIELCSYDILGLWNVSFNLY